MSKVWIFGRLAASFFHRINMECIGQCSFIHFCRGIVILKIFEISGLTLPFLVIGFLILQYFYANLNGLS
jgi:hypothetical protein